MNKKILDIDEELKALSSDIAQDPSLNKHILETPDDWANQRLLQYITLPKQTVSYSEIKLKTIKRLAKMVNIIETIGHLINLQHLVGKDKKERIEINMSIYQHLREMRELEQKLHIYGEDLIGNIICIHL
jgi:hypothetical protein